MRRVRRKLNARAGFFQPLRLFENHGTIACTRERQRGGQAADAGSGDDDRSGTGHVFPESCSGGLGDLPGAFLWPRLVSVQRPIVTIERRAIGTDELGVIAHVAEDMRMIERRRRADAHEFLRADLDHGCADIIMEVRNDVLSHGVFFLRKSCLRLSCLRPSLWSGSRKSCRGTLWSRATSDPRRPAAPGPSSCNPPQLYRRRPSPA